MYNLLISLGVSGLVFAAVALTMDPFSAIAPTLLIFPLVLFLTARRTGQQVQAALAPIQGLLEARKVGEAEALLGSIKEQYGRWQFLLERQMDAQVGMLKYAQGQFDDALPLLERSWRDWSTTVAAACVHYRRQRFDACWKAFEDAAAYGPKEVTVYLIWATLRSRHGDRTEALAALSKGLEVLEGNEQLKALKKRVANKQKVDVSSFQMAWYQFFPEEMMQRMAMRGARPGSLPDVPVQVDSRAGPPQPRMRGKMARRR